MEVEQHVNLTETILSFVGVVFLIALGVVVLTQQFRKNMYLERLEQEELKRAHHIAMMRSHILVQEQERKRISQDLHDDLGAVLSIVRMHLLQVQRKHGENEELKESLESIIMLSGNSIESMRRISHELMPPQLERFGVIETLDQVCDKITDLGSIACTFYASENAEQYVTDKLISLTLYRVCMELINNTIKHSGATHLNLTIDANKEQITVDYKDNGKGMVPEYAKQGSGLKNMQDRVYLVGGDIVVNKVEVGYALTISFPTNY